MAHIYTYETMNVPIILDKDGVLEGYEDVVVSIKQLETAINKTTGDLGIDTEANTINLSLSQEETAGLSAGTAKLQVNIYYKNTERVASTIAEIAIDDNLYPQIMP